MNIIAICDRDDVSLITGNEPYYLESILCQACKTGSERIVKHLLSKGVFSNYALYGACIHGNENIVQILTDEGFRDDYCVSTSIVEGHVGILEILLKKSFKSVNAFYTACKYENTEMIDLLLKYHGDEMYLLPIVNVENWMKILMKQIIKLF